MSLKILTDQEVIEHFGDPAPYLGLDGLPGFRWESMILGIGFLPAPLPLSWAPGSRVVRFRAHVKVVRHLEAALKAIHAEPEAWATINDWCGCYAFRRNRKNPRQLSRHSWGLGPDMDVGDNQQGEGPRVHPLTIEIMEAHGFAWGGHFHGSAVDGMHFEFADLSLLERPPH